MTGTKINLETLSVDERVMIETRRAYQRKWRAENKDKVKEHNHRYWLKKAAEQAQSTTK